MSSLTILFIDKLNVWLQIFANKINTVTLHPVNKHLSFFFYRNEILYNHKLDENILKTLIQRNILPTGPNKKMKLIIYNDKFKTSHFPIKNNSLTQLEFKKKN